MTTREKILASLRFSGSGEIVWAPRWDLWFNAASRDGRLPEQYRGWDIYDVARELGMAIKGYGVRPYYEEIDLVSRRHDIGNGEIAIEYDTPYGTLTRIEKLTPELAAAGVRGRAMKEFVTERKDYDAAVYLVRNTRILPRHDEVAEVMARIGDDGVLLGFLGHAPAHLVMREFTGYEGFYYQLQDNPDKLKNLIQALGEQQCHLERVAVDSPATVLEFDGNYDAFLTPPPIYEKYFLSWHQRMADAVHGAGKLIATHTDGRNEGLLNLIKRSGFDIAEAFTPPPMTGVSVAQARAAWKEDVAIWGGLSTVIFTSQYNDEDFERSVWQTLDEAGSGYGFVLGTGDNVPTDASLARIKRIAELTAEWNNRATE